MNSLNSHSISPRIGIQALCVALLFSLSPFATARATTILTAFSPSGTLHSPSPASRQGLRMHPAPDVATAGLILGLDDGALMTLAKQTGDVIESAQPDCVPSYLDAALLSEGLLSEAITSSDEAAASERTVILSTGAIEADVDAFRALLGNPLNGATPGQQPAGRREINWDGVPAAVTNVVNFPNNFFNANSPRGLVYDRATLGLEVSDHSFTDINPTYAAEFNPFSGQKLFSPLRKNRSDIQFFVAGSAVDAAVRGFGVVFMDVDKEGSSGIILIGENGESLGRFLAPVRSDARGASFVGVVFQNPLISRVRIVTGNGALAPDEIDISQGGEHDLVVMDDFLYGEPTATGN